ncbi:MAG: DUF420 domain-containing protein [bacterium]|nr:DUF420 domain-containing protein [bacterium]
MKSKLTLSIIGLSLAIGFGLLWFIYYGPNIVGTEQSFLWLPSFNATMNAISMTCVVGGIFAIKKKNKPKHIAYMGSAIGASALFLLGYLAHHSLHGDTIFAGEGAIRIIYFATLISHIILTFFALPLILLAVTYALLGRFENHKAVVRYTVPIWLYVSGSGILIYLFLRI